jgi:phenylpyruvate tautomerase
MPLIKIEISVEASDALRAEILTEASLIVSKNTGKPEQYVMVTLSKADFAMAGEPTQAAFVDVRGIGGINAENNSGISKDICGLLQTTLSISPEKVYITFTDVPAQNWGHNGATFG